MSGLTRTYTWQARKLWYTIIIVRKQRLKKADTLVKRLEKWLLNTIWDTLREHPVLLNLHSIDEDSWSMCCWSIESKRLPWKLTTFTFIEGEKTTELEF